MAIAAAPKYLTDAGHADSSPGMHFSQLFSFWASDWRKLKEGKAEAIRELCKLPTSSVDQLNALAQRAKACRSVASDSLTLEAEAVASFATGLGNEHPLENGFAFLNPYGLPYLAGSGVKGVLRQAARELASEEWGDHSEWEGVAIDALFGIEGDDGDSQHFRGVLSFWDVIPQLKGDSLSVEIMTPHQSHYYQNSETPHESGAPNPIFFLAVPPESTFVFHVQCDLPRLQNTASDLADHDKWKTLLTQAFEHAFKWLGFGAKTAVGYGAMQEDEKAKAQRERVLAEAVAVATALEKRKALELLTPEEQAWMGHEPIVIAFEQVFADAKLRTYQPGSPFDQKRIEFVKNASGWSDVKSRLAAGELLWKTLTKGWGVPSNKERKAELQSAAEALAPKLPA